MAIRPPGSYTSKSKVSKKSKSRQKENKFHRKQFFNLKTKTIFPENFHGLTCHTKLRSKQNLTPFLLGRTFSANQGDLNKENTETHRNFSFKVAEVRGHDCISYFNGMYLSRDCISSMVRKWHTLIETEKLLTTKDGSTWRFFVTAVTKRHPHQTKKTTYIKTSEEKKIRQIIFEILEEEVEGQEVDKVMSKLSSEAIGKKIELACGEICNLNAVVSRVKPVKNMKVIELLNKPEEVVESEKPNKFEILQEN